MTWSKSTATVAQAAAAVDGRKRESFMEVVVGGLVLAAFIVICAAFGGRDCPDCLTADTDKLNAGYAHGRSAHCVRYPECRRWFQKQAECDHDER